MAGVLRDAILDNMEYPLIALSADGITTVTNQAADLLMRKISNLGVPNIRRERSSFVPKSAADSSEGQADLSWLFDQFTLCDPDTWIERPQAEWPLYKAAILGQKVLGDTMGALTKDRRVRSLIDFDAFPMWDERGKFLGGMLFMRDVSHRLKTSAPTTESLQRPLQPSGHLGFEGNIFSDVEQQTSHSDQPDTIEDSYRGCLQHLGIPAFTTTAEGVINWFNDTWYEYVSLAVVGERDASRGPTARYACHAEHLDPLPPPPLEWFLASRQPGQCLESRSSRRSSDLQRSFQGWYHYAREVLRIRKPGIT
jgi:hypothetical protein